MRADADGTGIASLKPGRLLRAAVAAALGLTLAVGTVEVLAAVGSAPGRPAIFDFHAFHIAGRLALEGRFAEGYDVPRMRALQRSEGGGRDVFLPFAYPPAFGLVVAALALLPVAPAFLLFAGATLAFYLAVLRRLAGPWFALATLVSAPAALIDLRIGQNGLLTGGLVGLSAALALRGRGGAAGAVAGLLAVKPHLAVGLALALLTRRDGRALAAGAAVAAAVTVLSVALLGSGVVAGFRGALASTAAFMAAGAFPLHRMTSLYACALSFGATPPMAAAIHGVVALAVLVSTAATAGRLADRTAAAGLWIMSTAFVSPYIYDYDLPVFCAGLALALPVLAVVLSPRPLGALLMGVATAETLGLVTTLFAEDAPMPSLGGPVLLAAFGVAVLALRRRTFRLTATPPAAVPTS